MVEGINGAGMTYQGSTSASQSRAEGQSKIDSANTAIVSEQIAKDNRKLTTNNTNADGNDAAGQQNSNQQGQNAQIKKAVDDINKSVIGNDSEAIFGIHDKTNRVTIKIVDKKTKEVIREYPPEKTLDMIAKVWEMAGIMVDEKR